MKLLEKIYRLERKAAKYAKWDDVTEYFAEPEIIGYTSKGNRIMRKVYRLSENLI